MSESTSTAQWVEQLYEPQSRRLARQRLVAAGAVGPLLECLGSHNQSVVWAAVVSLGELRAKEATEPLLGFLERGMLQMDVAAALARITGHDLGTDPRQWRETLGASTPSPALDAAKCIAQTADYLGVVPSGSGGTYLFQLSLDDGRKQCVAVFFDRRDAQQREMVVVYSECGPVKPKYYEALLRQNLTMPFGAFAVRDVGGEPIVVVVESMAAGAVTPGILASKIEQIAAWADKAEKQLTQEDRR